MNKANCPSVQPTTIYAQYPYYLVEKQAKCKPVKDYDVKYILKPLHILMVIFAVSRDPYFSVLFKRIHCLSVLGLLMIAVPVTLEWRSETMYINMTKMMKTMDTLVLVMLAVMASCNLLTAAFQESETQYLLRRNYSEMDNFTDINKNWKYRVGRIVLIRLLFSIFIPLFIIIGIEFFALISTYKVENSMPFLLNYILIIMNTLVSIQFIIAMYSVRSQFFIYNIQLQSYIERYFSQVLIVDFPNRHFFNSYYNYSFVDRVIFKLQNLSNIAKDGIRCAEFNIEKMTKAYMLNCDQCDLLSSYFSVQNFFIALNGIISIIRSLHTTTVYATQNKEIMNESTVFVMIGTCNFALYDILVLYFTTGSCELVIAEARKTSQLMDAIIYHNIFDNIERVVVCSQLISRRLPKFTAWGFFSIDFSLLFSMGGTITTYLIMMLQQVNS